MAGNRFSALDAYRGIAALVVMAGHFGFRDYVPHFYLAVDLFFMMSGFVVVMAYEQKLLDGLSPWAFMRRRLARLWPLYAVGVLLVASTKGAPSDPHLAVSVARELLFIPRLPDVAASDPHMFGLNDPAWSLFLELLINFLFALSIRSISSRVLLILITLSTAALLGEIWWHGTLEFGSNASDIPSGLVRALAPFATGVWLARAHKAGRFVPLKRVPAPLLAIAAMLACCVRTDDAHLALIDGVAVLAVVPMIVAAGVQAELSPGKTRAAAWLGLMSYPLYILHRGSFRVAELIYQMPTISEVVPRTAAFLITMASMIGIAIIAGHVDRRVREWLGSRRPRNPAAMLDARPA